MQASILVNGSAVLLVWMALFAQRPSFDTLPRLFRYTWIGAAALFAFVLVLGVILPNAIDLLLTIYPIYR